MATELGTHSPKLDAVRALRTKAGRREQGRFAVEGATMLAEALAAGRVPEAVYATRAGLAALGPDAPRLADRTFVVTDRAMERLSDLETAPGLLAVHPFGFEDLDDVLRDGEPAVLLAGVSDPGNAGTLLRTAEIFGFPAAICAAGAVEPHNPKVVRATMGAIFRLRICVCDADTLLATARGRGYAVVAATRDGIALPSFTFPKRAIVAIGNERRGVASWLPRWDFGVSIPQPGAGESLNAAIAGGIIFYTFSQQSTGMNLKT